MKPKTIFLALCFAGAILPYRELLPWLLEHGLDLELLVRELFADRISAFFGLDVVVSAMVLFVFIAVESSRQGIRTWWLPTLATLTVGVSLGFPLFLYLREVRLEPGPALNKNAAS